MKPRLMFGVCVLALLLALSPLRAAAGAGADRAGPLAVTTTFSVNTNGDDADAHDWLPGDGMCLDTFARCTLRAAIEEANASPGADVIVFDLPMVISVSATEGALPHITEQLRIDAGAVWNAAGNRPGVTLNGVDQSVRGLALEAPNCEVYGLLLTNFTDAIDIHSAYSTVGGPLQGQRNVIAGNGASGVDIHGPSAHHNVVWGNWIGLSISGDAGLPNFHGVVIEDGAYANTIGGDAIGEHNVISGNTYSGVQILNANTDGNLVGGNIIGLPAVGSQAVGNGGVGVYVGYGPRNTQVGGFSGITGNLIAMNGASGVILWDADSNWVANNTIAGNGADGVSVIDAAGNGILSNEIAHNHQVGVYVKGATATGNAILLNSIHDNGATFEGIRLAEGGNTGLAAPVITTADFGGAAGTGCAGCTVHLFSDLADEGQTYAGFATVDGGGHWSYAGHLTGPYVTATNTDAGTNTSEFSAAFYIGYPYAVYVPWVVH